MLQMGDFLPAAPGLFQPRGRGVGQGNGVLCFYTSPRSRPATVLGSGSPLALQPIRA